MAPQMENPNPPQNAADVEINNLTRQITEAEKQLETLRAKKQDLDRQIEEEQKAVDQKQADLQKAIAAANEDITQRERELGSLAMKMYSIRAAQERVTAAERSAPKPAPQPLPVPEPKPAAARPPAAAPAIKYILDGDIAGPDGAPAAYNQFNVLSKASGKVLASGKTDKKGHLHIAVPERSVIVEVDGVRYPQEAEPAEAPKPPGAAAGAA